MPVVHGTCGANSGSHYAEGEARHDAGPRLFLNMFLLLQFFLLIYILVVVRLSGTAAATVLIVSLAGLSVGLYLLAKQIIDKFN